MNPKTKLLLGLSAILVWINSNTPFVAATQWPQIVSAKISIVWTHDGRGSGMPVNLSRAVNLSIWPAGQIGCSIKPSITLLIAKNNEPTKVWEGLGQQNLRNGVRGKFPTFDFNDVPADMVSDPTARYRFVMYAPVSLSTQGFTGNVWVHAADPRTIQPNPIVPTGFSTQSGSALDTRIQMVWPHDERGNQMPVEVATRVNVVAEVFEHGSLRAIAPDAAGKFRYSIALYVAEGNNSIVLASYSSVTPKTYTVGSSSYTQWVFNDVPVQPGRQYHFLAGATPAGKQDVYPYSSIWTHAQDGRTNFPSPQEPPPCTP
jgi:hypothetical protein